MRSSSTLILIFWADTVFANNANPAELCSSSACILKDTYNKMDLPPTVEERPVEVNFTLQLMDIFSIDHEAYTLHLNIVFRYKWIDNRITLGKGIEAVDKNFLNHLWMPHIYVYDSRYDPTSSSDNSGATIENCDNNTCINFVAEIQIDFTCWMDYSKFPFNTNICIFEVTPFSSYDDKVVLNTKSSSPPDEYLDKRKIRHYAIDLEYLEGEDTLKASWGDSGTFNFHVFGCNTTFLNRPTKDNHLPRKILLCGWHQNDFGSSVCKTPVGLLPERGCIYSGMYKVFQLTCPVQKVKMAKYLPKSESKGVSQRKYKV